MSAIEDFDALLPPRILGRVRIAESQRNTAQGIAFGILAAWGSWLTGNLLFSVVVSVSVLAAMVVAAAAMRTVRREWERTL